MLKVYYTKKKNILWFKYLVKMSYMLVIIYRAEQQYCALYLSRHLINKKK